MVTKRPSSRRRNNSDIGVSKARPGNRARSAPNRPGRKTSRPIDLLADLHAYRRSIAARFNYDVKKIGAYFDAVTIPPGLRVIEFSEIELRSARKSSKSS
jgi:hypothetical protein